MDRHSLDMLGRAVDEGAPVSTDHALEILEAPAGQLPDLMAVANRMRRRFFGDRIDLCSVLNARSGACSEDCAFCAQSASHATGVNVYELKPGPEILSAYREATRLPIGHFGVVTSGSRPSGPELQCVSDVIARANCGTAAWCASLGSLNVPELRRLKDAGLKRFHHNLETAESFFPRVCTTHTYADRLRTVRAAREAGLEVCSGGILGMGETNEQRVELAAALQREGVDSIPLNFLVPVKGTRLEHVEPIRPLEILKCIVMFRMVNPSSEIKVCAGRVHLGGLQSFIFYAGATGMMIGPLLTVAGGDVESDLRMLRDLEMEIGSHRTGKT